QVGDVVVELETDKVDVEVGATAAGVLARIVQPAGSDVRIGDVLGVIDGEAGTGATAVATASEPAPQLPSEVAPSPAPEPVPALDRERATPVARRMAAAAGVDLAAVPGSGAGGRVTKQDVAATLTPEQPALPAPARPAPQATLGQPASA